MQLLNLTSHTSNSFEAIQDGYMVEGEELWVKWGKHLAEYPEIEFFEKPRVLLRRLISRQFRLMAAYTEATFANDSSTFNVVLRDDQYSSYLFSPC